MKYKNVFPTVLLTIGAILILFLPFLQRQAFDLLPAAQDPPDAPSRSPTLNRGEEGRSVDQTRDIGASGSRSDARTDLLSFPALPFFDRGQAR